MVDQTCSNVTGMPGMPGMPGRMRSPFLGQMCPLILRGDHCKPLSLMMTMFYTPSDMATSLTYDKGGIIRFHNSSGVLN